MAKLFSSKHQSLDIEQNKFLFLWEQRSFSHSITILVLAQYTKEYNMLKQEAIFTNKRPTEMLTLLKTAYTSSLHIRVNTREMSVWCIFHQRQETTRGSFSLIFRLQCAGLCNHACPQSACAIACGRRAELIAHCWQTKELQSRVLGNRGTLF